MSLLDKVKSVAQDAAAAAKKGTAQVQEKMEQAQLRKKADDAAKQIGYLIVRERTKGEQAGGEVDRLVSEIVALEAQLDESAAPASDESPTPPTSASEPASGDFKLD